jgi:recombination protein RecT
MSTQVAQQSSQPKIISLLKSEEMVKKFAEVVPSYMTPERMLKVSLLTMNRTPKLQLCTVSSTLNALMSCAAMGVEPDGRLAHLIPYGKDCQLIIDYKGLIALARRNGVENIAADVVCENDVFEWQRDDDGLHFKHQVDWRKERGPVFATFCIWKENGQFDGEVMQISEVEAIRKRSRSGESGPWKTDYNEMVKKTVVRRASKKWPLTAEVAQALEHDDPIDGKTMKPAEVVQSPTLTRGPSLEDAFALTSEDDDQVPMDDKAENAPAAPDWSKSRKSEVIGEIIARLKAENIAQSVLLGWGVQNAMVDVEAASIDAFSVTDARTILTNWETILTQLTAE